ncbi:hypothetical protein Trydic_g5850 [Trypoxylus dichotomus]
MIKLNLIKEPFLERLLENGGRKNRNHKTVCLQGTFSNADGAGLVILEKTAFEEDNLKCSSDYFSTSSYLKKVFHNDIYGNYEYYPVLELNSIKTTVIHPATEKHIEKYSVQNPYIVDETPDIYESIVLPYIIKEQFDLQWVYNILEHKCEADRILFEDPDPINGFVLLPDLKWNGITLDTLYFLAIVNDKHIKSLRDLKGNHISLLKNIYEKGCQAIEEKYGLNRSQLRIYLHYQPSFYHLHVHFTYLKHEAPGIHAERAHLLSNVIINVLVNLKRQLKTPQISLSCDSVFITEDIVTKIPCKELRIVYNSLNNVQVTDKFVSFRFATSNDGFGSFKSEILQLNHDNDKITSNFNFANDSKLRIQCGNCTAIFCESTFKRILPLPSEHSEPSDWFCHNHHGNDSSMNKSLLDPSENDFFYSLCYCHLNSKAVTGFIRSATNLVCKRCLAWIGVVLNENCFKIWFNTIQISHNSKIYKTSALDDAYLTIRNILKDSLLSSARIILHCQVGKEKLDYLMIELYVAKVLFKFQSGPNVIVNQWINDVSVSSVEISKLMMIEVLKHLYAMNKLLPKEWSSSNDFYISYLPLYDNDK